MYFCIYSTSKLFHKGMFAYTINFFRSMLNNEYLTFDSYITQRMIIIHILLICKWCFALHFSNLNPIYDIKEIGYGFGMDFGSNIRWILAQWSKYTDKKCNKKLKFLSTYIIEIFLTLLFWKTFRQWICHYFEFHLFSPDFRAKCFGWSINT